MKLTLACLQVACFIGIVKIFKECLNYMCCENVFVKLEERMTQWWNWSSSTEVLTPWASPNHCNLLLFFSAWGGGGGNKKSSNKPCFHSVLISAQRLYMLKYFCCYIFCNPEWNYNLWYSEKQWKPFVNVWTNFFYLSHLSLELWNVTDMANISV